MSSKLRTLVAWLLSSAVVLLAPPSRATCPEGLESIPGLVGCFYQCPSGYSHTAACTCHRTGITSIDGTIDSLPTPSCPNDADGKPRDLWGGLCYSTSCSTLTNGKRTSSLTCEYKDGTEDVDDLWTDCYNYSEAYGQKCPVGYTRTAVCTCHRKMTVDKRVSVIDAKYGASIQPTYSCPAGTEMFGGFCYKTPCPAGSGRTTAWTCSNGQEDTVTDCELYGQGDVPRTPGLGVAADAPLDLQFLVATDLHYGNLGQFTVGSQLSAIYQLNNAAANGIAWPNGWGAPGRPRALVLTGDVTHYGHEHELAMFRERYEAGYTRDMMPLAVRNYSGDGGAPSAFPTDAAKSTLPFWYGFGNHDLASEAAFWRTFSYARHRVERARDTVAFDVQTGNYAWNWGRLHLVQMNALGDRWAGHNLYDQAIQWLKDDLARWASDGRPVILFGHYSIGGHDSQDNWPTSMHASFDATVAAYNVIGMFSGHDHLPELYREPVDNFRAATSGQTAFGGASGYFGVHVTDRLLEVVYQEWCPGSAYPSNQHCDDINGAGMAGPKTNMSFSLRKYFPAGIEGLAGLPGRAIHCAADGCHIPSGPGCLDTVYGQCSFPKASAIDLCARHPICRGVVCNAALDTCQARDAAEVAVTAALPGMTSYILPAHPSWTPLAGQLIPCASGTCKITHGVGCERDPLGGCQFPIAEAKARCAAHPQCAAVTCANPTGYCYPRTRAEVADARPAAGWDSFVSEDLACPTGWTPFGTSPGGFCCSGALASGGAACAAGGQVCARDRTARNRQQVCSDVVVPVDPMAIRADSTDQVGLDGNRRWLADVNGDGKAEYCRASFGGDLLCSAPMAATAVMKTPIADWGQDPAKRWLVDVNADGKADFCRATGSETANGGQLTCAISTGSGFSAQLGFTTPVTDWGYADRRWMVDFDGDGRADFCRAVGETSGSGSFLGCLRMTASGAYAAEIRMPVADWGYADRRWMADVNGDGKADLCRAVGATSGPGSALGCALSTGTSLTSGFSAAVADWGFARRWLVDVDGDQRADLCRTVGALTGATSALACLTMTEAGTLVPATSTPLADWGSGDYMGALDASPGADLAVVRSETKRVDVVGPTGCPSGATFYAASSGGFCCAGPLSADRTTCAAAICALDPARSQDRPLCSAWTQVAAGSPDLVGADPARRWLADIDGDGASELCRASAAGELLCTAPDSALVKVRSPVADWGYADRRWMVDINGDQKADLCRASGATSGAGSLMTCSISTGTGLSPTLGFSAPVADWGYPDRRWMVDFDGDGRTDFCRAVGATSGAGSYLSCARMTESGQYAPDIAMPIADWGYANRRWMADINADGKADFCRGVGASSGSGAFLGCALSTGFGLVSQLGFSAVVADFGADDRRWLVDVNGDRRADLCRGLGDPAAPSTLSCLLMTPAGTFAAQPAATPLTAWGDQRFFGDDGSAGGVLQVVEVAAKRVDRVDPTP